MLTLRLLLIVVLLCCISGCDNPPPSQPDRDLVVVDLSTSLSDSQRSQIANLVLGFVLKEADNAEVSVLALDSDMGNRTTLVPNLEPPDSGTGDALTKWQIDVRQWARELKNKIDPILKWPKAEQNQVFTSCYIASAVFANQYFAQVPHSGRQRLIWVGDLIEDCPLQQYHAYRLPAVNGTPSFRGLNLSLNALKSVEISGVLISRDFDDGQADVLFGDTTKYWNTFSEQFGLGKLPINNASLFSPSAPIE